MKSWKSFLVGSMTTVAFMTLVLVSVFAAFNSTAKVGPKKVASGEPGKPFPDPSLTAESTGPFAPVAEHFCADQGVCAI